MIASTGRHVIIIGSGAIGTVSAIECLRVRHRVTVVEPGQPGGEHATSYGNAGWPSSHSVIPPAEPGILSCTKPEIPLAFFNPRRFL